MARHPKKGVWEGTKVEHLGFVRDSMRKKFTIREKKKEKLRARARSLLNEVERGCRWEKRDSFLSFADAATALHLAPPLALFYTRFLHNLCTHCAYTAGRIMQAVVLDVALLSHRQTSARSLDDFIECNRRLF